MNHIDFHADMKDLTSLPQGPTGLEAWPDILVRITRMPVVSIALIRGRATGNGSEIALACDMSFASREKAVLSQWEVGVGLVAGGGPMARLPRQIGRQRALEVLLSSDDIGGDLAEAYGYVNRSLSDGELDGFVDALATRIASFDKWAIANTKRLVNAASLPADIEIAAGWDDCMTAINRPAAQGKIKALLEQGFHRPGDAEDRLGAYLRASCPLTRLSGGRICSIAGGATTVSGVGVSGDAVDMDAGILASAAPEAEHGDIRCASLYEDSSRPWVRRHPGCRVRHADTRSSRHQTGDQDRAGSGISAFRLRGALPQ